MIYTNTTTQAMRIAYDAHVGQIDNGGVPYIFHPMHLAEQMKTEATTVVALLHDVVEDSRVTVSELRSYGFPEEILEAVTVLTHEVGDNYFDYIAKVKRNDIARIVKIADLKHNMDRSRLGFTNTFPQNYSKYAIALAALLND